MKVQNFTVLNLFNNNSNQKKAEFSSLTMKKELAQDTVSFSGAPRAQALEKAIAESFSLNSQMTRIGKQWKTVEKAAAHFVDELKEVMTADDSRNIREEIGDEISVLCGIADNYGLDVKTPLTSAAKRGVIFGADEIHRSTKFITESVSKLANALTTGNKAEAQKHLNACVALTTDHAHAYGLNPAELLEETNQKIGIRFRLLEKEAKKAGLKLEELKPEEVSSRWEASKKRQKPISNWLLDKKFAKQQVMA